MVWSEFFSLEGSCEEVGGRTVIQSIRDEIRVITTSHADISVLDTLDGKESVVFIHANSLSKEIFDEQLAAFAGNRRVIAIDLPGHGGSSDAADARRTYCLEGYADCVAVVLEAIGVERAVIVGWSLGGHVGLELTTRFPGLLGLMALGTPPAEHLADGSLAGFLPHPQMGLLFAETLSDAEAAEFASLIGGFKGRPSRLWVDAVKRTHGLARKYMLEAFLAGPPRRQRELAERCAVPLALVNGGADTLIDRDHIDSLTYTNLWSGRQIVMPGQGHAPHVQAAAEFNRILGAFLDDVAPV